MQTWISRLSALGQSVETNTLKWGECVQPANEEWSPTRGFPPRSTSNPLPPSLPHSHLAFLSALIAFHIEHLSEMINPCTVIQCSRTWAALVTSRSICDLITEDSFQRFCHRKGSLQGVLLVGSGSPLLLFHPASSLLPPAISNRGVRVLERRPVSRLAALTPDSREQVKRLGSHLSSTLGIHRAGIEVCPESGAAVSYIRL